MGFLKFLKFLSIKLIKRTREADRVAAVDLVAGTCIFKSKGMMPPLILFSWEEIQRLSMNFSTVIGYGGFSTVYLSQFPNSNAAAVKIQCGSERLNQVHKQELEILLRLDHPNIVKLIGHCNETEEGILVMEYVNNGTLHTALHDSKMILPWRNRVAIAFQLAQAIEYLHDKCTPHIVHCDIKASNVLLDGTLNCKLCDFGSAKMGFSSMVAPPSSRTQTRAMMMGSPGYTDPHYLRTGLASKKNDVYSLGVIVLELITGMEAFDPKSGQRLTTKVQDPDMVVEMMDTRLRGLFDLKEAKAMAALSAACLAESPALRPCAADVVAHMQGWFSRN